MKQFIKYTLLSCLVALLLFDTAMGQRSVWDLQPGNGYQLGRGDVIYAVNGQRIRTWNDLVNAVNRSPQRMRFWVHHPSGMLFELETTLASSGQRFGVNGQNARGGAAHITSVTANSPATRCTIISVDSIAMPVAPGLEQQIPNYNSMPTRPTLPSPPAQPPPTTSTTPTPPPTQPPQIRPPSPPPSVQNHTQRPYRLERGDVITAVNGQTIRGRDDMRNAVARSPQRMQFSVRTASGQHINLETTLDSSGYRFGIVMQDNPGGGVRVMSVDPNTPATRVVIVGSSQFNTPPPQQSGWSNWRPMDRQTQAIFQRAATQDPIASSRGVARQVATQYRTDSNGRYQFQTDFGIREVLVNPNGSIAENNLLW